MHSLAQVEEEVHQGWRGSDDQSGGARDDDCPPAGHCLLVILRMGTQCPGGRTNKKSRESDDQSPSPDTIGQSLERRPTWQQRGVWGKRYVTI